MNFIQENMINNSIKLAYYKLNRHKELGIQSNLNVFEVAELMDTIKRGDAIKNQQALPIFYNVYAN
jgi:hypothetical protein